MTHSSAMSPILIVILRPLCSQDRVDGVCVAGQMTLSADREADSPPHCYATHGVYQCGTIHEGMNQCGTIHEGMYKCGTIHERMYKCGTIHERMYQCGTIHEGKENIKRMFEEKTGLKAVVDRDH